MVTINLQLGKHCDLGWRTEPPLLPLSLQQQTPWADWTDDLLAWLVYWSVHGIVVSTKTATSDYKEEKENWFSDCRLHTHTHAKYCVFTYVD